MAGAPAVAPALMFGRTTSATTFPGSIVRRNVIVGGHAGSYPADNFFPGSVDGVAFANRPEGRHRLGPASPYRRAGTDGHDIGVDFEALMGALAGLSNIRLNAVNEPTR